MTAPLIESAARTLVASTRRPSNGAPTARPSSLSDQSGTLLLTRRAGGQADPDVGRVLFGEHLSGATVGDRDRMDDRETETEAGAPDCVCVIGAAEAVECVWNEVFGQSGAFVANVQLDLAVSGSGLDVDGSVAVPEGVVDEVAQCLLETQVISVDDDVCRGVDFELTFRFSATPRDAVANALEQLAHWDRFSPCWSLPPSDAAIRSRSPASCTSRSVSSLATTPEDGTFGNRYDDPRGEYRVLYATSQRVGAFIETLARYRNCVRPPADAHRRPRVGPPRIQNIAPTGSVGRSASHASCPQTHRSIPTSRRLPRLPWRTRVQLGPRARDRSAHRLGAGPAREHP
jgi:hypothetical protein